MKYTSLAMTDVLLLLDSVERKVTTVKSAKNELINLIRSLISFGNTLGELPRERILNIKVGAKM